MGWRDGDPRWQLLLLRSDAGGDRELRFAEQERRSLAHARAFRVSRQEHDPRGWRRHSSEQGQGGLGELGRREGPSGALCGKVGVGAGWDCRLSQEHAILTSDEPIDFSEYPIGTVLVVYPNHSCMTAAQHEKYLILEGDQVVDTWVPAKFWFVVCSTHVQCYCFESTDVMLVTMECFNAVLATVECFNAVLATVECFNAVLATMECFNATLTTIECFYAALTTIECFYALLTTLPTSNRFYAISNLSYHCNLLVRSNSSRNRIHSYEFSTQTR